MQPRKLISLLHTFLGTLCLCASAMAQKPLQVFVLAGDENVLEQSCPQYADHKPELAGLIWFQGEKDATKPKAEAYEAHLANLIRDLRKDWKRPELPVVVTAIANSKRAMPPFEQQVFDAQMAVGNPQKHPEFSGNVTSIDTRPMCRPTQESPGGRDRYNGNATSYLEIGDTMVEAILKLQTKPAH